MTTKTYIDENGYRRFTNSDKLVHRYLAEKKLKRKLRKGEVVHHIDRNKLNNSKRNLWVFKNQEEHHRAHEIDARKYGRKTSYKGFDKSENPGCFVILIVSLFSITYLLLSII